VAVAGNSTRYPRIARLSVAIILLVLGSMGLLSLTSNSFDCFQEFASI
jgi:hypothetical protein